MLTSFSVKSLTLHKFFTVCVCFSNWFNHQLFLFNKPNILLREINLIRLTKWRNETNFKFNIKFSYLSFCPPCQLVSLFVRLFYIIPTDNLCCDKMTSRVACLKMKSTLLIQGRVFFDLYILSHLHHLLLLSHNIICICSFLQLKSSTPS